MQICTCIIRTVPITITWNGNASSVFQFSRKNTASYFLECLGINLAQEFWCQRPIQKSLSGLLQSKAYSHQTQCDLYCDKVILSLQHYLSHSSLIGQFHSCRMTITKIDTNPIFCAPLKCRPVASQLVWMVHIKTTCSTFFLSWCVVSYYRFACHLASAAKKPQHSIIVYVCMLNFVQKS